MCEVVVPTWVGNKGKVAGSTMLTWDQACALAEQQNSAVWCRQAGMAYHLAQPAHAWEACMHSLTQRYSMPMVVRCAGCPPVWWRHHPHGRGCAKKCSARTWHGAVVRPSKTTFQVPGEPKAQEPIVQSEPVHNWWVRSSEKAGTHACASSSNQGARRRGGWRGMSGPPPGLVRARAAAALWRRGGAAAAAGGGAQQRRDERRELMTIERQQQQRSRMAAKSN